MRQTEFMECIDVEAEREGRYVRSLETRRLMFRRGFGAQDGSA